VWVWALEKSGAFCFVLLWSLVMLSEAKHLS